MNSSAFSLGSFHLLSCICAAEEVRNLSWDKSFANRSAVVLPGSFFAFRDSRSVSFILVRSSPTFFTQQLFACSPRRASPLVCVLLLLCVLPIVSRSVLYSTLLSSPLFCSSLPSSPRLLLSCEPSIKFFSASSQLPLLPPFSAPCSFPCRPAFACALFFPLPFPSLLFYFLLLLSYSLRSAEWMGGWKLGVPSGSCGRIRENVWRKKMTESNEPALFNRQEQFGWMALFFFWIHQHGL